MKELNNFLLEMVGHCSKCEDCANRFNGGCCFFAYECLQHDFSFYKYNDERFY